MDCNNKNPYFDSSESDEDDYLNKNDNNETPTKDIQSINADINLTSSYEKTTLQR